MDYLAPVSDDADLTLSEKNPVGSVLAQVFALHDAVVDGADVFGGIGKDVFVVAQLEIEPRELAEALVLKL